jgi:hypothetical protein
MGPVNWLAVLVAGVLGAGVLWLLRPPGTRGNWLYVLQIIPAAMLGHALARIGPDKLAVKPQLYAMQAGGLALAIVIPALWIVQLRSGGSVRQTWRDSFAFLLAYLVMGGVFWAIGFK